METNNLKYRSTGEPTYWPTNPKKLPDVIDIYVMKGINNTNLKWNYAWTYLPTTHQFWLSCASKLKKKQKEPAPYSKKIVWDYNVQGGNSMK